MQSNTVDCNRVFPTLGVFMKPPKELVVECPVCKAKTAHQVLGGRVEGKKRIVLRSSVKCCSCGHVHAVEVVEEKSINVPIILSWMEKSIRSTIALYPSEEIKVGDEIYLNDERLLVTSMESSHRRPATAKASELSAIWAKKFTKVRLKVSLDFRGKVLAKKLLAVPEEEFNIGDTFEIDGRDAVITSIRTGTKTVRKGSAVARDIVRIYAKGIRR